MKRYKNLLFYIITVTVFSFIIFSFLKQGSFMEQGKVFEKISNSNLSSWGFFKDNLWNNITEPLSILLLQIFTIIIIARVFGFFCSKIGQPTVIGEILAGIFLGPSFVGMYLPEVSSFLFPIESLGNLQFLSQIGLILFMFVIGMDLDLNVLKNNANDAIVISHSSIITPFTLGVVLAYYLYPTFGPENINFLSFALFIGISMSITAFPVLARIVQERNLSKSKLGILSITCAAADDITAWCLLAIVIAIVKAGSVVSAFYTILMSVIYVLVMVKLVQPFFKKIGEKYSHLDTIGKPVVALFFITLLISAFTTEIIGIHALFGAFMAGVMMPADSNFRSVFIEKVEDVALLILLPLFFVYTGLRTQVGLLNDSDGWIICFIITGVAVAGKFIGSSLAAKFVGENWKDSLSIGALMNTRGLMELIVLNIGYDLGVLNAEMFTMLVIMALLTTFMTGPLLNLINRIFKSPKTEEAEKEVEKVVSYNILVSISSASKGIPLMQIANSLIISSKDSSSISLLHLSPTDELNQHNQKKYVQNIFFPLEKEAKQLNILIKKIFKYSSQIDDDISKIANTQNYDLLLLGYSESIYEGSVLGKIIGYTSRILNPKKFAKTISTPQSAFDIFIFDERINNIVKDTQIPVGIYMDKNHSSFSNIYIPIMSISDQFLFIYSQKFIKNNNSKITLLDLSGIIEQYPEIQGAINYMQQEFPNSISVLSKQNINKGFISSQNLMLTSLESWKKLSEEEDQWLYKNNSVLIIKA